MQVILNLIILLIISHSLNKLTFNIKFNMLINLLNQKLDKIQNFTTCINIKKAIKLL